MRGLIGATLIAAAAAGGLYAQASMTPEAACAVPMVASPPWVGWDRPVPLVAADRPGAKPVAMLVPGRAASVTLAPSRDVAFVATPTRTPAPVSYGGMMQLNVPVAGTYRVAIGAPAWIDMVSGGQVVASVAHDHGPACSGIVKTVDFALSAGPATIEFSGAPTPVATAMAVRVS